MTSDYEWIGESYMPANTRLQVYKEYLVDKVIIFLRFCHFFRLQ